MAGSLTVAAGIDAFFATSSLRMVIIGYVVMRLAVVALWLRAARHHPERRKTARTYAGGITLVQLYWIALLPLQPLPVLGLLAAVMRGAVLEIAVPVMAERHGVTPWRSAITSWNVTAC